MGGRGSMGGTRSTYRGNSTELFNQGKSSQFLPNLNNKGDSSGGSGGGASTKGGKKGTSSSKTGGIDNGQGGGKSGSGGGSSTAEPKPTTDINEQAPLTDEELFKLFLKSDDWRTFDQRNETAPEEVYLQRERAAFTKWMQSNSVSAEPKPQEGALDNFRRVPKVASTLEEVAAEVHTINPHYNDPDYNLVTPKDPRSRSNRRNRNNCQRCVVAGEGRARGYDVMAVNSEEGFEPRVWDQAHMKFTEESATDPDGIAELFVKDDGTHPEWEYATPGTKGAMASEMESKILAWGEGARGFVGVEWENGGAHIFSVRVIDGKVYYIDYQLNQHGDELGTGLTGWKPYIEPNNPYQGVLRVDNTRITDEGATWMKERNNLQINAPTFDELDVKLQGMTPQEQDIWASVWQQVRSGDRITLPTTVPENLAPLTKTEILEIAREAWKWMSRPD